MGWLGSDDQEVLARLRPLDPNPSRTHIHAWPLVHHLTRSRNTFTLIRSGALSVTPCRGDSRINWNRTCAHLLKITKADRYWTRLSAVGCTYSWILTRTSTVAMRLNGSPTGCPERRRFETRRRARR